MRCIPNFPSIRFFFYLIFNISFQTCKECIHTRIERCKFGVTEKEHNLNIQNTRWTSSQQYSSKEEGGVEWGGGLLPFLPCKKIGLCALKAAFGTGGFPVYHLTVENSPSIAARTWARAMFQLRAKNNIHHQKEPDLAKKTTTTITKKNFLYQFFPIYACPLLPLNRPREKMSTPIL